jgi:amino acid transporter
MWEVLQNTIPGNIGMGLEYILLIVIFAGGIIFYALDFKIGVLLHFFFFGLDFLLMYKLGLNWVPALVITFMFLVIMAFTFYSIAKTGPKAGAYV